jgi:hypothetical protein
MKDTLLRIVRSAVTAFHTRRQPTTRVLLPPPARRVDENGREALGLPPGARHAAFLQKADFNRSMRAFLEADRVLLDRQQERMLALRTRLARLRGQLELAEVSTEAGWDDLRSGLARGYEEFRASLQQAHQWAG